MSTRPNFVGVELHFLGAGEKDLNTTVAGCATGPTREQIIANDGAECQAYGARP
jgi:hypothetical protein